LPLVARTDMKERGGKNGEGKCFQSREEIMFTLNQEGGRTSYDRVACPDGVVNLENRKKTSSLRTGKRCSSGTKGGEKGADALNVKRVGVGGERRKTELIGVRRKKKKGAITGKKGGWTLEGKLEGRCTWSMPRICG